MTLRWKRSAHALASVVCFWIRFTRAAQWRGYFVAFVMGGYLIVAECCSFTLEDCRRFLAMPPHFITDYFDRTVRVNFNAAGVLINENADLILLRGHALHFDAELVNLRQKMMHGFLDHLVVLVEGYALEYQ